MNSQHDWLLDLFEPFGPVSIRRMFGGAGLYRDGLMFGLVADGAIFLKCDGEIEALFREAGAEPFAYDREGRNITMSYFSLPSEALDDSDALALWAGRAFEAARRGAKTKKPRKPKKKR